MGTSAEGTVSCHWGLEPALATALKVLLLAGSQALLLLRPCLVPLLAGPSREPADKEGCWPSQPIVEQCTEGCSKMRYRR